MCVQKDTLDGLLRHVFEALLADDRLVTATRGDFSEVLGWGLRHRRAARA